MQKEPQQESAEKSNISTVQSLIKPRLRRTAPVVTCNPRAARVDGSVAYGRVNDPHKLLWRLLACLRDMSNAI